MIIIPPFIIFPSELQLVREKLVFVEEKIKQTLHGDIQTKKLNQTQNNEQQTENEGKTVPRQVGKRKAEVHKSAM